MINLYKIKIFLISIVSFTVLSACNPPKNETEKKLLEVALINHALSKPCTKDSPVVASRNLSGPNPLGCEDALACVWTYSSAISYFQNSPYGGVIGTFSTQSCAVVNAGMTRLSSCFHPIDGTIMSIYGTGTTPQSNIDSFKNLCRPEDGGYLF